MIIYKITNIVRNKCYIGQTTGTFKTRYRGGGKWWKYNDNILLRNAYNKYGAEAFTVEILETNVSSIEELNRLESFYAEKFNAYSPNGYNLRGCGDNKFQLPETVEKVRVHSLKTRYARKIDTWEIVEIKDLVRFCEQNKLSYDSMYSALKGGRDVISTGGYCSVETSKEKLENRLQPIFKNEPVYLCDQNGNTIYVSNPKKFAEDNDLKKGSFYKLLRGEMMHYKGYRLPENLGKVAENIKKFELCFNFGPPQSFVHMRDFCKKNNLCEGSLFKVLKGEMKIHRGWHLESLTEEKLFMTGLHKKLSATLLDPDGKAVYIENIAFFCYKNNLPYMSFYYLIKRNNRSCLGWTTEENEHLFNTYVSPDGTFYKSISPNRIATRFSLNKSCLQNIQNPNAQANYHKGWTVIRFGCKPKVKVTLKQQGFLENYILPQ